MIRRLRDRLSYANVLATLALFLALGGGAVYAAGQITGADVKDDSLTGKDIKESTLKVSRVVARPSGTSDVTTSSTPAPYPLSNNKWTQRAGEVDTIVGEIKAVNQTGCDIGSAGVTLRVGDQIVGTGNAIASSSSQSGTVSGFIAAPSSNASRTLTGEVTGACISPFGGSAPPPTVTEITLTVVGNR